MKMTKRLAILLAAVAFPMGQAVADVTLPTGLSPGSQYQLIFVTSGTTVGYVSDLGYYNTFVTDEAALSPTLPTGATWHVVGSNPGIDANVNAPWLGLPVFNTAGQQVDPPGSGIYTGLLSAPVGFDQFGSATSVRVWTGSDAYGVESVDRGLGNGVGASATGLSFNSDGTWLADINQTSNQAFSFYALSSAITVVPEPSGMILAALGLAGGLVGRRRITRKGVR